MNHYVTSWLLELVASLVLFLRRSVGRLKVKPPTTLTFICQPIKSETQGKSIVFLLSLQFFPLDPVNSMNQFVILNARVGHDNLKCTNIRKTLDSTFATYVLHIMAFDST